MAQLKKVLAGSFAVMMAASMMAGCGSDDSSNGGGNTPAASQAESSDASKKQLRICTWNEEFKNRLREFYDQYDKEKSGWTGEKDKDGNWIVGTQEFLKDGTEIVWMTTPNKDNAYQNKLDTDLAAQANNADKIDMFLIEADYALKYTDGPYAMAISEVGLTDDDLKDQYEYTKLLAQDSNGVLKAVSWQATPGLFAYKRDIAREVLGTDDPDEVQKQIADWDKFNEVAAKMKEKGYFMLSGYDDSYRTFSNNVSKPWVDENKTIQIDDNLWKWVDQTKEYTDKGYNNKSSLWDETWAADQSETGKVFGFFYSTWGIDFTLSGNIKGKTDAYYVCYGPQSYYWGGTWMCAAVGTDNLDIVKDIMKKMTCDATVMKEITDKTQDFTNNQAAMKELSNGFKSEFLGGQNHVALFVETAPKIDASKVGPYDQACNESFQNAFKDYFTGQVDKDTATANFYKYVTEKHSELKKPE